MDISKSVSVTYTDAKTNLKLYFKSWFGGGKCNSACNYYRNVQQVQTYPHRADHGNNKHNAHEGYTLSFVFVIKVYKIQV